MQETTNEPAQDTFERLIGTPAEFPVKRSLYMNGDFSLTRDHGPLRDRFDHTTVPTNASNNLYAGRIRIALEDALNRTMTDLGYRRIPWDEAAMRGDHHIRDGEYAYREYPIRIDEWGPQTEDLRRLAHLAGIALIADMQHRHWHGVRLDADTYDRLETPGRLDGDLILEAYGLARAPLPMEPIDMRVRWHVAQAIREHVDPHFDQDLWKDPGVTRTIPYGYHDAWLKADMEPATMADLGIGTPETSPDIEAGRLPDPDPTRTASAGPDMPATETTIA